MKDYVVSTEVKESIRYLGSIETVKKAMEFIEKDHEKTLREQVKICEIPSFPFKEEKRAQEYAECMKRAGLTDVYIDEVGNVIGVRPGKGNGPKLVLSAHLDIAFPEGTDTTVVEKNGKLCAPGICDDTRGLVEILTIIRALNKTNIQTEGDLIFLGTVGEEGLGDLRGVKYFFKDNKDIDGFITIDGIGLEGIGYLAMGSKRYEIIYEGVGGHSFSDFGTPSAVHALGRAIAKIANFTTTRNCKTTFNVGVVKGGSAVNAIASEAKMLVDLRSTDSESLTSIEKKFLKAVKEAAEDENKRMPNPKKLKTIINQVGDRPLGNQSSKNILVQVFYETLTSFDLKPNLLGPGSTDANIPISKGIPAVYVGSGGIGGNMHSLNEWFDPTDAYLGPQKTFLAVIGLVGIYGKLKPLLKRGGVHNANKD